MGFGVLGSGFKVQGLGFRVFGLEFRVSDLGFRVWGFGSRVLDLQITSVRTNRSFRIISSPPGVSSPAWWSGFWVWCLGFGVCESGLPRVVHSSRHEWPGGLVN